MHFGRTTLSKFLIQQLRGEEHNGNLAALLVDVAAAIKSISAMLSKGALGEFSVHGDPEWGPGVRSLDALADETLLRYCEWGGLLSGMSSERRERIQAIPEEYERGPYLLAFNALDRTGNLDVNVSVGSVFSVLRARPGIEGAAAFLQPGREQVAAGYALYGPATLLVVTVGKGTHGFTLDRETGNFILTHPALEIPAQTCEFAVNASKERWWDPPVARYVRELKAGQCDVRGRDFTLRWIASLVAQMHRLLLRGGVFLNPRETREPNLAGKMRLLHEANPLAFLVEQAGGMASTGRGRILDVVPEELHQRVPAFLGSREEVERLARYHAEFDAGTDTPYASPLFNTRSLFRAEARA